MTRARYDYHTGLTSFDAAEEALADAFAGSEVHESERPNIEKYHVTTRDGRKLPRWKITLAA